MLYDKDIREPLFEFLEEKYGKIRILEEKKTGRSRADVVMVKPDAICGLEIKSDADTYARLKGQVSNYDQYYDYNYVVVGTSHALHIKEHVPGWWGIITVELEEEKVDFYVLREASANPSVDWLKKITVLWRPELAHIQELNGMPRYKEKSKSFVIEKILLTVKEDILQRQMCEELFERDYNEIEEIIREYRRGNGRTVRGTVRTIKKKRKGKNTF